jgi:hypothetical protein
MTKKREFLKPVSVLAALLLSGTSQANAANNDQTALNKKVSAETANNANDRELLVLAPDDQVRSPNQHGSHASHGSHGSHTSSYK